MLKNIKKIQKYNKKILTRLSKKIYTKGTSILALKNGNKMRLGVFKNGGEDEINFEIPKEFANGKINEIYPCIDNGNSVKLNDGYVRFKSEKSLAAVVYEIEI